jgi:hypothetical protein
MDYSMKATEHDAIYKTRQPGKLVRVVVEAVCFCEVSHSMRSEANNNQQQQQHA